MTVPVMVRRSTLHTGFPSLIYYDCKLISFNSGKGHYSKAVAQQARLSLFIPVSDDFKAEDC